MSQPTLYILAGPNGAGKTTASLGLLPGLWDCSEFVNADEIARGLSPFRPAEVAFEAGRLQLKRIRELLDRRVSFSIETTLATRSYTGLVADAHSRGYRMELMFFYLPSVADAMERVRLRVSAGGHDIPAPVIARRYALGLSNLFKLYMPIVDTWRLTNNMEKPAALIADFYGSLKIYDTETFNRLRQKYGTAE